MENIELNRIIPDNGSNTDFDTGFSSAQKLNENATTIEDIISELITSLGTKASAETLTTLATLVGTKISSAQLTTAINAIAPKVIPLNSITTAPDATALNEGDKYYNATDKLIYEVSNIGDEWVDGTSPRLQDVFTFNGKLYQSLNNDLQPSGRGIVGNPVRTSGNGAAGTTDIYTTTYSDGTTSTFTVTNGANGTGVTLEQVRSQQTGTVPSSKLFDDEMNKKVSLVVGKNKFDKSTITPDKYVNNTTGALVTASAGWFVSDFIPITAGQAYKSSENIAFSCYFGIDGSVVPGGIFNSGITSFTPPSGAVSIRITANSNLLIFQIELGSASTSYEAYEKRIVANISSITGLQEILDSKATNNLLKSSNDFVGKNNATKGVDITNFILQYGETGANIANYLSGGTITLVANSLNKPLASSFIPVIINQNWTSGSADKKIVINNSAHSTVFTLGFWINKTKFDALSDKHLKIYNGTNWVGITDTSVLVVGYSSAIDMGSGKFITIKCLASNSDWMYIQVSSTDFFDQTADIMLKYSSYTTGDIDFASITFVKSVVELNPYKIYYKLKTSLTLSEVNKTEEEFKAGIVDPNLYKPEDYASTLEYANYWLNSGEVGFPESLIPVNGNNVVSILPTPIDSPFNTKVLPTIRSYSWTNTSEKKIQADIMSDAPKVTFLFWTKASQLSAISCTTISILSKVAGVQAWRTVTLPAILNAENKNILDEEMRLKMIAKYGDWVCYRLQWDNTVHTNYFMFRFDTSASTGTLYFANVFFNKSIIDIDALTIRYKLRSSTFAALINEMLPALSAPKNFLYGNEFFSICDSLGAGGVWQNKLASLSGAAFDNAKNIDVAKPLSIGGTGTVGSDKSCGQWRARNFVANYPTAKILLIENINDMNFSLGSLTDTPFMLSRVDNHSDQSLTSLSQANTYWTNNFASIVSGYNILKGVVINIPYYGAGKNLAITHLPTSNGSITLTVNSKAYSIAVTTSDTIATLRAKILEYQYENVTDSANADGVTVDFYYSTGVTLTFAAGGTGVTVSIIDTSTAQVFTPRFFIGEANSTDWNNTAKWTSTTPSVSSAYRGLIEYLQKNAPTCELIWIITNRYGLYLSSYLRADGTPDIDAFNAGDSVYQDLCAKQIEVCEKYKIRYVDLNKKSGITLYNFLTYYNENNVHPKIEGYEKWGEMIYKLLIG